MLDNIPLLIDDNGVEVNEEGVGMAMDEETPVVGGQSVVAPVSAAWTDEAAVLDKVPITIVTGYLGSGKSTLLDTLAMSGEKKFAVIVNEFGNSSLIEKSKAFKIAEGSDSSNEWLDLGNGCLCCSVKDSGVAALENLLSRERKFDYVLLETSGVADPGPIANMFWLDEGLKSNVYIDGVVVVVDAKNILACLADTEGPAISGAATETEGVTMAHIQLSFADVIVLNKVDLVDAVLLQAVRARLRGINGVAPIHETSYGQIASNLLLNLHAFDRFSTGTEGPVHHDGRIATVSFRFGKLPASGLAAIEQWLQYLLWEHPEWDPAGPPWEVYRTKGLVVLEGSPDTWKVIQGVRETYDITDGANLGESQSIMVLIGKHVGTYREALLALFEEKTGLTLLV